MSIAHPNVAASLERRSDQLADATMMLILMLTRRGRIANPALSDAPLSTRTLGLIGFGDVGRAVAKRARQGFGMRVLVHGRSAGDCTIAEHLGVELVGSLDEVLFDADVVSLHCDGGADNHHLIDAHRLNQMKPDAFLINTAHGALVDEQALVHALWFETIGGVGIGVPLNEVQRLKEFRACDNAIILPHPSNTRLETRKDGGLKMIDNVVDLFDGHRPSDRA